MMMENVVLADDHPGQGQFIVATDSSDAAALLQWQRPAEMMAFLRSRALASGGGRWELAAGTPDPQRHAPRAAVGASAPDRTWNGGLGVPFWLEPGEQRTVKVLLAWHFPNRYVNFEQFWAGTAGVGPFAILARQPLHDQACRRPRRPGRGDRAMVEAAGRNRRLDLDLCGQLVGRPGGRASGGAVVLGAQSHLSSQRRRPVLRLRGHPGQVDGDVVGRVRRIVPAQLHPCLELREHPGQDISRAGTKHAGDRVRHRPGSERAACRTNRSRDSCSCPRRRSNRISCTSSTSSASIPAPPPSRQRPTADSSAAPTDNRISDELVPSQLPVLVGHRRRGGILRMRAPAPVTGGVGGAQPADGGAHRLSSGEAPPGRGVQWPEVMARRAMRPARVRALKVGVGMPSSSPAWLEV